jgi:RHS repeat-associated protein
VDSFTGKPDQIVSDEYDFAAREEHNGQGRWISPDPMSGTGNKYAYADNNPLGKIDLYGMLATFASTVNGQSTATEIGLGNDPSEVSESHPQNSDQTPSTVDNSTPADPQQSGGGTAPAQQAQKSLTPADKAAVEAERAAYAKKDTLKKEYGGVGYTKKDGTIATTKPKHIAVEGEKDSEATAIRPSDRPKGTRLEFTYHSHGPATPRSNEFSTVDMTSDWINSVKEGRSIPGYIGDANGGVYKYTPNIDSGTPESDGIGRAEGQIVTVVPPN